MKIKIDGWRAHITFSSAHFIPDYNTCGRLHGHTYAVHAAVEGEPDARGIIMDFSALKQALRTVAGELDHRVLVPERGELAVRGTGEEIEVLFRDKRYLFPAEDCICLPLASSTAENLASYVLQRVQEELAIPANVSALHVGVDEGYGQGAWVYTRCGGAP
ncbi:MAG: 6-pyruvoyl tetrahydropterin synthase family protein [Candidatus Thermoplasmatota archaeon]|nr:6-pyruvoyl tetrahydropterin synthase family protein [Candidatus Thermoplasmatota archaeon]